MSLILFIVSLVCFNLFVFPQKAMAGYLGDLAPITNSSFENGNIDGWSIINSYKVKGIKGSVTADNTTFSNGSFSAKINLTNKDVIGVDGYFGITQKVKLLPNTYYQFSLDERNDNNNANIYLDLISEDKTVLNRLEKVTDEKDEDWKTIKFNFKTPPTIQNWIINIRLEDIYSYSSENLWIDNVTIRKIDSLDRPEFAVAAIGDSQLRFLGLKTKIKNGDENNWLSVSVRKSQINNLVVIKPINKGLEGDRVHDVAARVKKDVVDIIPKPEICYIAVGTNDAMVLDDPESFSKNMESIIKTLKDADIKPILFKITPRLDDVDLTPYNDIIARIAASQNVILFDPTVVFNNNSDWRNTFMADSIHYNGLAHSAIGKFLGYYLDDYVSGSSAALLTVDDSLSNNKDFRLIEWMGQNRLNTTLFHLLERVGNQKFQPGNQE